ncbi:DUF4251 domain-containing protein [Winogradskyella ouciana]|uniref:DUF4251 domain-containing protein n=1 Tax=Winogradskyella ouciana TaxID=2608631 RepID=UPI003D2CFF57
MRTRFLIGVIALLIFNCGSSKSEAELATEARAFSDLKTMVATKTIRFDAQTAYPFQTNDVITVTNALMRQTENANGRFSLSANNDFLEIRQDSAKAKLSYFGELRTASYADANDTSIKFDNIIEAYSVSENDKKKTITISFKVRNATEQFNIKMLLYPSKKANVAIYGSNRTTIQYNGDIEKI